MTNPSAAATTRAKGGTSWTSVTVQTLVWHTGHCRPAGVDFLRIHSAAVSLRSSRATTGSIPSHSSSTCGMVVSLEVVAQLKLAHHRCRRERVGGTRTGDRKPWQDRGREPDRGAALSRVHQVVRQLAALTSQPGWQGGTCRYHLRSPSTKGPAWPLLAAAWPRCLALTSVSGVDATAGTVSVQLSGIVVGQPDRLAAQALRLPVCRTRRF
jgi:hypothetical protein